MKRWSLVATACLVVGCAGTNDDASVVSATALSPADANHSAPSYSPDGSRLAYWIPDSVGSAVSRRLVIAKADLSDPVITAVTAAFEGPPALWSPDGTMLATLGSVYSLADVVLINADGSGMRRLTSLPGLELPTGWFPDNDRVMAIASSEGGVESIIVQVSTGAVERAWPEAKVPHFAFPSPDGSRVAYQRYDGSKSTLWLQDLATKELRQLTTEGYEEFFGDATRIWSPDGTHVVYTSRRTGTNDIWVMPVDSGAARQVTRDVRHDRNPTWSPNGRHIAFLSERGRQTDLWIASIDGGDEIRVTDTRAEEGIVFAWRPDASALTFVEQSDVVAIRVTDIENMATRDLVPDSLTLREQNALSPDGKAVVVIATRGGGDNDVVLLPTDGAPARVLLSAAGEVNDLVWSPDSRQVAFLANRSGSYDVWTVDVASGTATHLVPWAENWEFDVTWPGDGAFIYFTSDRESRYGDLWRVPAAGGTPERLTTTGDVQYGVGRAGLADVLLVRIDSAGLFNLVRLASDGRTTELPSLPNILDVILAQSGEHLAVFTELSAGNQGTVLVPKQGAPRPIGVPGDIPLRFSTDGQRVALARTIDGGLDLVVLDLRTDAVTRVTSDPAQERFAAFTPDDKSLVYSSLRSARRLQRAELGVVLGAAAK